MRRNRAVLALLVTAALAACGVSRGSDADGAASGPGAGPATGASATTTTAVAYDRSLYVSSLASALGGATDDLGDATCVAEAFLDAIDLDRLRAAGVVPGDLDDDVDVLEPLDLTPEEKEALGDDVGAAFLQCGATEAMLRASFEDEAPGAISGESARCAAEALTPLLGDRFVEALEDPDVDIDQGVSNDAIGEVLGACPTLAVEVMVSVAAEDGYEMTPEERSCLLDEFTRLGEEPGGLAEDTMGEGLATCLDR